MRYLAEMTLGATPARQLTPVGIVFLVVVSFIWPIYYYLRSAFRSFGDGLASQVPFKISGVLLLAYLISSASGNANRARFECSSFDEAQFKFFSLAVFGYLAIMSVLRSIRAKENLSNFLKREDWPRSAQYVDGALAVCVELITAPWILEGFREALRLPPSKIIDWGLRISESILSNTLGRFLGTYLGAGDNFLNSGAVAIDKAFTGHAGFTWCGGGSYQGKWLLIVLFAILLLPGAVAISFEPLHLAAYHFASSYRSSVNVKECEKCDGIGFFGFKHPLMCGALCPDCSGSGDKANKGRYNVLSFLVAVIAQGIPLVISWIFLVFVILLIRGAVGE